MHVVSRCRSLSINLRSRFHRLYISTTYHPRPGEGSCCSGIVNVALCMLCTPGTGNPLANDLLSNAIHFNSIMLIDSDVVDTLHPDREE